MDKGRFGQVFLLTVPLGEHPREKPPEQIGPLSPPCTPKLIVPPEAIPTSWLDKGRVAASGGTPGTHQVYLDISGLSLWCPYFSQFLDWCILNIDLWEGHCLNSWRLWDWPSGSFTSDPSLASKALLPCISGRLMTTSYHMYTFLVAGFFEAVVTQLQGLRTSPRQPIGFPRRKSPWRKCNTEWLGLLFPDKQMSLSDVQPSLLPLLFESM